MLVLLLAQAIATAEPEISASPVAALVFPLAPRVKVGDIPTSAAWNGLAEAANRKARSGLGDMHYRESDYCINWARQIRLPDEFGNYPTQGEYWEINALLNPINDIPWTPVMGPGEPEGTNTTSPAGTFVFGDPDAGFQSEFDRIGYGNFDLWQRLDRPPLTLKEWWDLAKLQRGVIDPATNNQNVPAIEAARRAQFVGWSGRTPHGKTWGGEFPTPVILSANCGFTELEGFGIPSYEYKFTAAKNDVTVPPNNGTVSVVGGRQVITYAGSCPFGTAFADVGHVQGIARLTGYYIVFVLGSSGPTFDLLPRGDWVEGPYTEEGKLDRRDAGHFDDAVYDFCVGFRGVYWQRTPDDFDIEKVAFSFKEFHDGQYFLSPNRGREVGGSIRAEYPTARLQSDKKIAAGTKMKFDGGGGESRSFANGFVMGGCYASAENLSGTVRLEVLSGTAVVATLELSPENPQALKLFPNAKRPAPLSVRLADKAEFTAAGEIVFEASELLAYKPDHWDAYLLLRLSATKGGDEFTGKFVDGGGSDEANATELYTNYKNLGAIVNVNTAGVRTAESAINTNPVYEAMRARLNTLFRMFHRNQFISYGTDASGRPVLKFLRYAYGLKKEVKADNFEGIAPSYFTASEVVDGVEYVVRSHTGGSIKYRGKNYTHEKRFIGSKLDKTFEIKGDALLLEYEGIRAEAPIKGYSNEWLFSEEFHFEHPSITSLWHKDHYADWYVRGNRCGTYADGEHSDSFPPDLARVADLPVYPSFDPNFRNLHLSPEIPSGFNYYGGLNSSASPDFCSSCPIYKAPYEILSAKVEFSATGDDVVVLVFKEPFHRDAAAPTAINPDPLTWTADEIAALRAEPYRTTDNGLREYALFKAKGTHGSWKVGDSAFLSSIQTLPDNPFGAIFPRFFATSLVKKVHSDGNNSWDENDTRMAVDEMIKLRIKLKCWCEGAVDGTATVENVCGGGSQPFDFTFESMCFKAFGGSDIERPQVNTELKATTFNQLAACLDELHMFTLRRGVTFEATLKTYDKLISVTPTAGDGCTLGAGAASYWEGTPPSPDFSGSFPSTSLTATCQAGLTLCGPDGVGLGLISSKQDIEFRYVIIPGFENAIPPAIKNLIEEGNIAAVGTITRTSSVPVKRTAVEISQTDCTSDGDGPGAFGPFGAYFEVVMKGPSVECAIIKSGTLSAGNPPGGTFSICSFSDASTSQGYAFAGAASGGSASFDKLSDDNAAIIVVTLVEEEVAS